MKGLSAVASAFVGLLALQGCSLEKEQPPRRPPPYVVTNPPTQMVPLSPVPTPPTSMVPPRVQRVIPTDERAVGQADVSPPPISGGTLLVSHDDELAFASDPDRDRVSVIDLAGGTLLHTIALEPGDEPGRLAEDAKGRVHVALRRGGVVVSIDPANGKVVGRHAVCGAPRGIAYEAATDQLHVACAGGELVSLAAEDGTVARRLALGTDLRDVVVNGSELLVTRFKSAELLWVNAQGRVRDTLRPNESEGNFMNPSGFPALVDTLEPHAAWRSVVDSKGQLVMLHQMARTGVIELPESGIGGDSAGGVDAGVSVPGFMSSPYGGGGFDCDSVVQTEVTRIDPATRGRISNRLPLVLAVDVAVSPFDGSIALASAGVADPEQPLPKLETTNGDSLPFMVGKSLLTTNGVVVIGTMSDTFVSSEGVSACITDPTGFGQQNSPAVAVAYTKDGRLLAQSREPAMVAVYARSAMAVQALIALGGDSVYDTGHELFHRDAGGGLACASCHMEGGEDGHTWVFSTFGERRTQALHVGLEGTAPFHWQGDMDNVAKLMEDVMVGRMGGVHQSPARAAALQHWLFELQPPAPVRSADDEAALRGQALFEGEAECRICHNGAKLTDNRTVDVGTGQALQVPSLVGIAYRAPFIHNGCATTLRERFEPGCGGSAHGKTAELSDAQIDDLVAYLETL